MKAICVSLLAMLSAVVTVPKAQAAPTSEFCRALRAFVVSVQPDETREFTFRTSWGANFKNAVEPAISAKLCEHEDYAPAERVCAYLMDHGSTEFAGANVKDAVSCLSHKTRFDSRLSLNEADFSLSYGSENRGVLVDVTLKEDAEVGGMTLKVVAHGY
jgi:hypothetical protein